MVTRRDILQVVLGGVVLFLMAAALVAAWLMQHPPKPQIVVYSTASAADVDALFDHLRKPDRKVGQIPSIWIAALSRLEALGPAAAPFGAIEKLEAFIATAPEGEAKKAAERALAKIKGQAFVP
ncbi:MAG TPA: hypothetical protein VHD36_09215 [Pirellulales bacterium]|nr:hypothetical protein [Pirellulales bacterium]